MASKEATPLSTMLGKGEEFTVGEHSYRVLPLKLKDVDEFTADSLSINSQLFNLIDKKTKAKVNKWLSRQVKTDAGEPVSLDLAYEHDWDLDDLKNCLLRLVGISG